MRPRAWQEPRALPQKIHESLRALPRWADVPLSGSHVKRVCQKVGRELMPDAGSAAGGASESAAKPEEAPQPTLRWVTPRVEGVRPCARAGHTATLVGDELFVFGGADRTPTVHSDLHVLHMPNVVAAIARGQRLTTDHADCAARWEKIEQPSAESAAGEKTAADAVFWPAARTGHTATRVGSTIYVLGGEDAVGRGLAGCATQYLPFDVLALDTTTRTWRTCAASGAPPAPRASHAVQLSADGVTLAVFGGNGGSPLNDLHLLHTDDMSWAQLLLAPAVAPSAREMHSMLALPLLGLGASAAAAAQQAIAGAEGQGSALYVAGGRQASGAPRIASAAIAAPANGHRVGRLRQCTRPSTARVGAGGDLGSFFTLHPELE